MIREKPVEEEMHDSGLSQAPHILGPPGNHIPIGAHRRETVGHASFAEKTLKQGVFEVLAHLQASLSKLPDMHVVPAGHIPFVPRNFKYGAMGLAASTPVTLGNFIIDLLKLLTHGRTSNMDGPAKSRITTKFVIPAKAGIQLF